ncbi:MAG: DEAD/DEAH box helicase family protein [Armatimonadetes bacterium]|nr:DEAD/DEAH box helicase family protein [Armatimonadota bacterium]
MVDRGIPQLIINSPYKEPAKHWAYVRERQLFELRDGRRPAGYVVATPGSKAFDDPGVFHELPLVNRIRPRVNQWREAGYPGVTGITRRLLEHWWNAEDREDRRLFFCQLEAIETLIWLNEAPIDRRQGIDVPSDGGAFARHCAKMATGSGKTVVMAMLIAWQVLNKVAYPQDRRFSKHVLVIAPGLTVRSRLQVLIPDNPEGDYYQLFDVVPTGLVESLRQAKVLVHNWHFLDWETEEQIRKRRSVDKRGAKSDEAYVRGVLRGLGSARDILVINDEAHHAWRVPAESKVKGLTRGEIEEATKWVGALDRIHRTRSILACYDFSATPFAPSGKQADEEALFGWIVSDFGLNDAIECGLVKTPRVVIRDDGQLGPDYRSRLYHIYADAEVKDDLNRRAEPSEPLPGLVSTGYHLLGKDWLEAKRTWAMRGCPTPPVMITVANRTETAARVKYAFDAGKVLIPELQAPERTVHIDSKVLDLAEAAGDPAAILPEDGDAGDDGDEPGEVGKKLTRQQRAEELRRIVDTVGKPGKPGEQIQTVISVGMLSEGWDAKTVTHIMGLRAFSSQLLCEQVVGRGLRRTSYDIDQETGLFAPEYVNVFGVPFTFMPHEGGEGVPPPPPVPKTLIEVVQGRRDLEISWPNVIRVEHTYRPQLSLDLRSIQPLVIDAAKIPTVAELAPVVDGKPDLTKITSIDLTAIGEKYRLQKLAFGAARDVFALMRPAWEGSPEYLLAQLIGLVGEFLRSDRIDVVPGLFFQEELRRRVVLALSMTQIVQHIWDAIRAENSERLELVLDPVKTIRSTGGMLSWYTGRPCAPTQHSHISHCVYDSTWEASEAFHLERSPHVQAWVKNDHLGFEILYVFRGVVRKYRPDYLVRLSNNLHLVLEVKGQESDEDRAKGHALGEWVEGVNQHGGFGQWTSATSRHPGEIDGILARENSRQSEAR